MPATQKVIMAVISALGWRPTMDLSPEFWLNLSWFLLSIGTLALTLARRSEGGKRRIVLLVSSICVFVLLFPIFSTSDDRAQQELLNDATSSQLVVKSLDIGQQIPVYRTKWSMPVAPLALAGRFETEAGSAEHCFAATAAYLHASDCRVLSRRKLVASESPSGTNYCRESQIEPFCADCDANGF